MAVATHSDMPGLSNTLYTSYDEQREHSMADEGGASGALVEAEEDSSSMKWKDIILLLGVFGILAYSAFQDSKKRKSGHLRVVR